MTRKCLTKGIVEGINFKSKNAQKQASKLCFTENQATAILEMRMQKLVGLELDALTKEYNAHLKNIAEYTALLGSKTKMTNKMRSEMLALNEQFARPRKTEIVNAEAVVLKPQEVKAEQVCVLVNRFGYIRMIDEATETRNQANLMKDHKFMGTPITTTTRPSQFPHLANTASASKAIIVLGLIAKMPLTPMRTATKTSRPTSMPTMTSYL